MNRRDFLRMLGLGAAAAAVPSAAENIGGRPESCDSRAICTERRIWQVPANAPVGSGIRRVQGLEQHAGYLLTTRDYEQRVIPYNEAVRIGIQTPVQCETVRYEEYEHLIEERNRVSAERMASLRAQTRDVLFQHPAYEPEITLETDSGHTYNLSGEAFSLQGNLVQHDPAHQPTLNGNRVAALPSIWSATVTATNLPSAADVAQYRAWAKGRYGF